MDYLNEQLDIKVSIVTNITPYTNNINNDINTWRQLRKSKSEI